MWLLPHTQVLEREPRPGEDDVLFEDDVEVTSLKRNAQPDPDNELECAGGGLEASISRKPRNEQASFVKLAFTSPVKPATSSASTAPQAAGVPSPRPATSPIQTEQRGTAGFWIAKMRLATILRGDACRVAKSQAEKLLGKLKDDAQVRRLNWRCSPAISVRNSPPKTCRWTSPPTR